MRIGSLFSGVGGLELGLERAGLGHTVWQVEKDPFCRAVLARHWPEAERFDDVTTFTNPPPVDLICGGFPCQDISSAGKGAGLAGSRSGLWFEFARIIQDLIPTWVVVENVASGAQRWVAPVRAHMGRLGYETLPIPLSARDVGAPHRRDRIFIIAHANGQGELAEPKHDKMGRTSSTARNAPDSYGGAGDAGGLEATRPTAWEFEGGSWVTPESPVCRVDDGISGRVDRIRALGNAVVPQCAEVIGWVIRELAG